MEIKLSKAVAPNTAVDEYDVRQVKHALNRLGYFTPNKTIGMNGIPDAKLFNAIKAFQRDQGVDATGAKPGDRTETALLAAIEEKDSKGKYIWRTVQDEKVRGSHAALEGKTRTWDQSPDPTEEYNCRCWAESVEDENKSCKKEKEEFKKLQQDVKELSKKFNDLLLRLQSLIDEGSNLIENAKKVLGLRMVTFILNLPFDRFGVLGEILKRYFENMISQRLIEAAKRFMKEYWIVKRKAEYVRGQRDIVFAELNNAAKKLEEAKKGLENCEKE